MAQQQHFEKILVANRGEIAVRVMRTARDLGYRTVAVYSEADADAPHVLMADEAVCIGPATVSESYLVIDKVLEAAHKTGADAIHPGYGFLSENCDFATACEKDNIAFIGPPPAAIELMGSKRLSKLAMIEAGVPCIPGYEGEDQALETLQREAKRIGFPVMVKASAGGGGRGMRLVEHENDLAAQIKTARSEAENAFGSGELILEKAVLQPRHIEIQVFADKHGNAVYLGERDCSVQRRHQKVVEEAPSPFVDEALREKMGTAAVHAALACDYVGAGTVEFLVDADRNFYFLEMNTRLQVEHPVTELITNTDLVAWQIKVAAGHTLPMAQEDITLQGHAMEVRLYAEDPGNGFLPQTGPIHVWQPAEGEGVRIDDGIRSGQDVSAFYDPMLAKIIAYGSDRDEARRRLIRAIEDSTLFGVTVNSHFLCEVLRHPAFRDGHATTAFIGEDFAANASMQPQAPTDLALTCATLALFLAQGGQQDAFAHALSGWSNSSPAPWPYRLNSGEQKWTLALQREAQTFHIQQAETNASLILISHDEQGLVFSHNGVRQSCRYHIDGQRIYLQLHGRYYHFDDATHHTAAAQDQSGNGEIKASMDGAIIDVLASTGDQVRRGDTLMVLEAMKMEHPLKADTDGVIEEIRVSQGDQVKLRQLLIRITPTEEPTA